MTTLINSMDEKRTTIKETAVGELIPYASNSRTHSQEQVAQIAASIKEFGFTNPILTDGENGIIAGHGRLEAARMLGRDTVPTLELSHLTPTQRKAYIIADNKLALNAEWDMDLLSVEMKDLDLEGFDLSLIGFDENDLNALMYPDETGTNPDNILTDENKHIILIELTNEVDCQTLYEEFEQRGLNCKLMS